MNTGRVSEDLSELGECIGDLSSTENAERLTDEKYVEQDLSHEELLIARSRTLPVVARSG